MSQTFMLVRGSLQPFVLFEAQFVLFESQFGSGQVKCLTKVEWDEFAQSVLKARMEDQLLPPHAELHADVTEFHPSETLKAKAKGLLAGFPCQVFCLIFNSERAQRLLCTVSCVL